MLFIINLFFVYPHYSFAENESAPRSSVSIELGADREGGQEQFFSIDTLVDEQHLVYFGYGRYTYTQSGRQRPGSGGNDFKNQLFTITLEDIADTPFNTGFGFEWWGNNNVLTTQTLSALLRYHWRNFSFELSPQLQRIRFVDIPLFDSQKSFDVSADGWAAAATYFSPYNWFVQLRRIENNFHFQESALGLLLARAESAADGRIFVQRRYGRYFNQATVLEVYRSSITVGTSIHSVDIGVDWSRGESLIGGFISDDISLSLGLPIAINLTLMGQIGQIRADAQTNLNYANITMTYHW